MQKWFRRIPLWLLLGIAAFTLLRMPARRSPRRVTAAPVRVTPAVEWYGFDRSQPRRPVGYSFHTAI